MDNAAFVRRILSLPITVGAARRLFPGIDRSALHAAAPYAGGGRFLPFGRAFEIARACAVQEAQEAKSAIAAAGRAADQEQARAAVALPAVAYLAAVIDREVEALAASLRARSGPPRAVAMVERIAGVNARQISRARARLSKGAHNGPA